jgi:Transposase DDE domain
VDLESFIVTVFVHVDDLLAAWLAEVGRPLRARGPAPVLADSEVLTMEIVGEFLGIDQDRAIVDYVRTHHRPLFPGIGRVHRTTFARQAANLWVAKGALWGRVVAAIPHDPGLALIDSVPAPVCRRAHAKRARVFPGVAAFGKDASSGSFYFGVRHHLRVNWPGVVTAISVAPANIHDQDLVPELVAGTTGVALADRNYWSPHLREELAAEGVRLLTPFKTRRGDKTPAGSQLLNHVRRRIETIASQLTERYHFKRIRARDTWHLTGRILRKVLSHSMAVLIAVEHGAANPRQLSRLVAIS